MDWLYYESGLWACGFSRVAGIDEAGRGPLAGPVIAAAVIFRPDVPVIAGIDDSKRLSARQRERLYDEIMSAAAAVGVGSASPEEIDRINILQATYLAMNRALERLKPPADHLLVDGRGLPQHQIPGRAIIKGDSSSMSIAAASIIAKVTRDRLMCDYHLQHPEYGFAVHKGYPTAAHIAALRRHGPCAIHRRSFHPRALRDES
jgi:ribonuclease HII